MQIIREQKLMFGERTKFLISEDASSPVWASALPTPPHYLRAIQRNFFIFLYIASNVQRSKASQVVLVVKNLPATLEA